MSTRTSEPQILDLAGLTDDGFRSLYAERLEPILAVRESERRKRVQDFRFYVLLGIPTGIIVGCAAWAFARDMELSLFLGLVAAVLTGLIASAPLDKLRNQVKIELLESIAAAIGARYAASSSERPGFDRSIALGLAPRHDRAQFEDFLHGEREGCAFDLYEAHLEVRRQGRRRTYYDTVFRGQIIRLAFPKAFQGVTIVHRDLGILNELQGGALKRVRLVDPKFERVFEVFSSDQVEARALIHPVFMERLMALEARFKGGHLRCGFEAGRLLVLIEGKNRFEPGSMFTPLTDPARARAVVDDIAQVLGLLDAVLTAEIAPLVALRAEQALRPPTSIPPV